MSGSPASYRTRASLRDDLRRLGVRPGDTIMLHAAMSRLGALLNGPDALSHAVLDAVGAEGTLMVYTAWDSVHDDLLDGEGRVLPQWREHVPGYDKQASRAVRANGVIAEFVRTMPGACRSDNPGAAVAAIGRWAAWLTADHAQDYGYGENSPFAKLVEAGGRVLMAGAPWDKMTLIHHADHLARMPGKRVLRYEVPFVDEDAKEGKIWRFIEEFDTSDPVLDGMPENYIEQIVAAFVDEGGGRQGLVGEAPSLLVEARPMLDFAIGWLEAWAASNPQPAA